MVICYIIRLLVCALFQVNLESYFWPPGEYQLLWEISGPNIDYSSFRHYLILVMHTTLVILTNLGVLMRLYLYLL